MPRWRGRQATRDVTMRAYRAAMEDDLLLDGPHGAHQLASPSLRTRGATMYVYDSGTGGEREGRCRPRSRLARISMNTCSARSPRRILTYKRRWVLQGSSRSSLHWSWRRCRGRALARGVRGSVAGTGGFGSRNEEDSQPPYSAQFLGLLLDCEGIPGLLVSLVIACIVVDAGHDGFVLDGPAAKTQRPVAFAVAAGTQLPDIVTPLRR